MKVPILAPSRAATNHSSYNALELYYMYAVLQSIQTLPMTTRTKGLSLVLVAAKFDTGNAVAVSRIERRYHFRSNSGLKLVLRNDGRVQCGRGNEANLGK